MRSSKLHVAIVLILVNISFAAAVERIAEGGHHLGNSLLSKDVPSNAGDSKGMHLEMYAQVPDWRQYAPCAGVGLGVSLVVVGIILGVKAALGKEKQPKTKEEAEKKKYELEQQFLADLNALKEAEEALKSKQEADAAAGGTGAEDDKAPLIGADKDRMTMVMDAVDKVREQVAPKFAKGAEVRTVLEDRMSDFKDRAKSLVVSELNGTCAAVMRAMDEEEHKMILDWNQAIKVSFPPLTILIAGLLSPSLMTLAFWGYFAQCFLVLLPVLLLCIWAKIEDAGTICAIPTMHIWVDWNLFLTAIMVVAQLALMVQIKLSSNKLAARRASMHHKLEAEAEKRKQMEAPQTMTGMATTAVADIGEMRSIFVSHSVLLQEAVLLEDRIRSSFWVNIAGIGTILLIITTMWTVVVVFGWTFVPGVTAFHPKAKTVAKEDFCGSWASVFTARLTCVMSMLFLIVNIAVVVVWFSDKFGSSDAFAKRVLQKAADIDKSMMGIPVVQTIVKALVLRGHGQDFTAANLAVAMYERDELEKESAELALQIADVEGKKKACTSRAALLTQSTKGSAQQDIEDNIKFLEDDNLQKDLEEWKKLGVQAVNTAEAKAAVAANAHSVQTEDIEKLIQTITEAANSIRNSPAVQEAVAGAQHLQELAQEEAVQMQKALEDFELGKQALQKAEELKKQIDESAAVQQAKDMAKQAAEQAQDKSKGFSSFSKASS